MKTIKGPGIFLAQFAGNAEPFNTLKGLAQWAAGLGFSVEQFLRTLKMVGCGDACSFHCIC